MKTSATEMKSLPFILEGGGELKDYEAVADYCEGKSSDRSSPRAGDPIMEIVASLDDNGDVARVANGTRAPRAPSEGRGGGAGAPASEGEPDLPRDASRDDGAGDTTRENVLASPGDDRDVGHLANEGRAPRTPPEDLGRDGGARASAPDRKFVFRDRANLEGRRSLDSMKKNKNKNKSKNRKNRDDEGELLRLRLANSQKCISGLRDELGRRDEQLLESRTAADEKVRELEEMTEYLSSVQGLLREMGAGSEDAAKSAADDWGDENSVSRATTPKEHVQRGTTIAQLRESLASRGNLMESFESLNVHYERTVSSLTQLIHEKDQALAEVEHFADMNECANKKILAHTHARHQEVIREARMKRERETTRLLSSLAGQADLIDSLEHRSVDSARTVSSLTRLVGEKDRALAEISSFRDADDCAGGRLLARANEKRREDSLEHASRTKDLHGVITSLLREKRRSRRELALVELRAMRSEMTGGRYLDEVNFFLAAMAIAAALTALFWRHESFLLLSPVYVLIVFLNLE